MEERPNTTASRRDTAAAPASAPAATGSETITVLNDRGSRIPVVGVALALDQPGARGPPALWIGRRGDSASAPGQLARVGGADAQSCSSSSSEAQPAMLPRILPIARLSRTPIAHSVVAPIAIHGQIVIFGMYRQ